MSASRRCRSHVRLAACLVEAAGIWNSWNGALQDLSQCPLAICTPHHSPREQRAHEAPSAAPAPPPRPPAAACAAPARPETCFACWAAPQHHRPPPAPCHPHHPESSRRPAVPAAAAVRRRWRQRLLLLLLLPPLLMALLSQGHLLQPPSPLQRLQRLALQSGNRKGPSTWHGAFQATLPAAAPQILMRLCHSLEPFPLCRMHSSSRPDTLPQCEPPPRTLISAGGRRLLALLATRCLSRRSACPKSPLLAA